MKATLKNWVVNTVYLAGKIYEIFKLERKKGSPKEYQKFAISFI